MRKKSILYYSDVKSQLQIAESSHFSIIFIVSYDKSLKIWINICWKEILDDIFRTI